MAEAFGLMADTYRNEVPGEVAAMALAEMLDLVGLNSLTQPEEGAEIDEEAEKLMEEREEARADKDFERADAIRDQLSSQGWEVRDSAEGPRLVPRS